MYKEHFFVGMKSKQIESTVNVTAAFVVWISENGEKKLWRFLAIKENQENCPQTYYEKRMEKAAFQISGNLFFRFFYLLLAWYGLLCFFPHWEIFSFVFCLTQLIKQKAIKYSQHFFLVSERKTQKIIFFKEKLIHVEWGIVSFHVSVLWPSNSHSLTWQGR